MLFLMMKVVTIISVIIEVVTKSKLRVLAAVIGDAGRLKLNCMAWLLLYNVIPESTGWTVKVSPALTCSRVLVVKGSVLLTPITPFAMLHVLSALFHIYS